MSRAILFRPEAEAELLQAAQWYESRNKGLGADFLRAVEATMAAIERNPRAYPIAKDTARRAVLRRFPYSVIYALHQDHILIIACFHGRRDPQVWNTRL